MRFAAVHIDTLEREPWLAATPAQLGAWLRLYAYACKRECDVIHLARDSSRTWMAACNVTLEERDDAIAGGLCEWTDDGGLRVHGYDHDGQGKVEQARVNGSKGGRPAKATGATPEKPSPNPDETHGITQTKPTGSDPVNPERTERATGSKATLNPSPLLTSPLLTGSEGAPVPPVRAVPVANGLATVTEPEPPPKPNAHATAWAQWLEVFREVRRCEYVTTKAGGDKSQLGTVLRQLKPDEVAQLPAMFRAYLCSPDPFVAKQGYSLTYFCARVNEFRGPAPPATRQRDPAVGHAGPTPAAKAPPPGRYAL